MKPAPHSGLPVRPADEPSKRFQRQGAKVVLVGVGNIGGQFVDHAARLAGLKRVLVVDRDRYETANLTSQAITARDVGRPKAAVQARRLRRLNPRLQVEAFAGDLDSLPLGWLRGAVVIGCLDSVHSRLRLGEMAWRMGALFLDGGVNPEAGLARVTCYLPGPARACCACGLSAEDYQAMGAVAPCDGSPEAPATSGTFALGGLAAAWLALECERILRDGPDANVAGREVLLETGAGRLLVSRRRSNPACRFDHRTWTITPLAGLTASATLAEAIEFAGRLPNTTKSPVLRLPGQRLAKALHCPGCGAMVECFHVVGRGGPRECPRCRRRPLAVVGFKIVDRVDHHLPRALLRRSLRRVGLRPGDVLAAECGGHTRYLEIPTEDA